MIKSMLIKKMLNTRSSILKKKNLSKFDFYLEKTLLSQYLLSGLNLITPRTKMHRTAGIRGLNNGPQKFPKGTSELLAPPTYVHNLYTKIVSRRGISKIVLQPTRFKKSTFDDNLK